jgi:hypothetical protein
MNTSNFFWQKATREAPDNPGAGADPTPVETAPVETSEAAPDLSFIPSDYIVDGKPDVGRFAADYQELVAEQARREPAPDTYDFAIPADLKFDGMPEGFSVELKPDDPDFQPLFADLGALLKEIGAPAASGGKIAALIARYEAAKAGKQLAAKQEEAKALGTPAQAQARVATIQRKLETMLPADQVAALTGIVSSAKAVMALEKLIGPKNMQPPVASPKGLEGLEALSPFERLRRINQARAG